MMNLELDPNITADVLITPWKDPIVDNFGISMLDEYTEHYWLPCVGPSALLIGRRLVATLGDRDYVDVELHQFATLFGLSYTQAERSPFGRGLHRLVMFGLAAPTPDGWAIRRYVPTVPGRLQKRWPHALVAMHSLELEARSAGLRHAG